MAVGSAGCSRKAGGTHPWGKGALPVCGYALFMCVCVCVCVCVSMRVIIGMCCEILVHTGVCPQLGLRLFQSQETTKEEAFKDLKPSDKRRESPADRVTLAEVSGCNTKERA